MAAMSTRSGSPCQAVAAASAAAAGGLMRLWSVSHADATPGMSVAEKSIKYNALAMTITQMLPSGPNDDGMPSTHPNRVTRPTTATVAYRINPDAYAIPSVCANVTTLFTSLPVEGRRSSVQQPQWHYKTEIGGRVAPPFGLDGRRALRRLERELHLVRRNVSQDLEQVIGIEADVERIAIEAHRELVLRLAKIGRLHTESEQRGVEREPNAVRLIRRDDRHAL